MQQNDIAYVLNASNTCPKPDFIPESHFLRVPVNDSFCEKILPWLDKSVEFIGQLTACFIGSFAFEVCLRVSSNHQLCVLGNGHYSQITGDF